MIDGPSADIQSLAGLSVARDGTGALVYVKNVAGVGHVFVSRLLNGAFMAPQQVDGGLSTPSSQPVIAAGPSGLLLVAFVNAGSLYVAQTPNALTPMSATAPLVAQAINPALSLSTFGKAYLAFTATGGAHDFVRTAFYFQGQWGLESSPLNVDLNEDAGMKGGRPAVATAGDGVGIVAWGEGGHIFTRRVVATTPSVAFQQADPLALDGWGELSSSHPQIATGGDSSYASVTFQEELSNGVADQSRVLVNHLHAGQYDGVFPADGAVTGATEGADQPRTAVTEYGAGWVTSERDQTHALFATVLGQNAGGASLQRVDSSPNADPPDAVPAAAGLVSTLIAWQQTPGISGPAEIRVRYAPDGSDLGPEQVVSSAALGATDADGGLAAGGDVSGDAALAWLQGTGADTRIVTAQLYQTPGTFAAAFAFTYATSRDPLLAWSPSAEPWGPVEYAVQFDGVSVGQTAGTAMSTPSPVSDGRHTWEVTATNQAGLTTLARLATVFVDTVAPRVKIRLSGRRRVGRTQRIAIRATDPPPPGAAPAVASGIASGQVRWGDGTRRPIARHMIHVYRRAGAYTITVVVVDRAGNRTVLTRRITIRSSAKIGPRPKHNPKHKTTTKKHAVQTHPSSSPRRQG